MTTPSQPIPRGVKGQPDQNRVRQAGTQQALLAPSGSPPPKPASPRARGPEGGDPGRRTQVCGVGGGPEGRSALRPPASRAAVPARPGPARRASRGAPHPPPARSRGPRAQPAPASSPARGRGLTARPLLAAGARGSPYLGGGLQLALEGEVQQVGLEAEAVVDGRHLGGQPLEGPLLRHRGEAQAVEEAAAAAAERGAAEEEKEGRRRRAEEEQAASEGGGGGCQPHPPGAGDRLPRAAGEAGAGGRTQRVAWAGRAGGGAGGAGGGAGGRAGRRAGCLRGRGRRGGQGRRAGREEAAAAACAAPRGGRAPAEGARRGRGGAAGARPAAGQARGGSGRCTCRRRRSAWGRREPPREGVDGGGAPEVPRGRNGSLRRGGRSGRPG